LIPFFFGTSVGWFLIGVARPILSIAFKNTKLTCLGKTDGGGSQVLSIVGVAAFAKFFGAKFIHTPLSDIEHCPEDMTMEEFCAGWETVVDLFGFNKAIGEEFVHYSMNDFLIDFLLFRTRGKQISLGDIHYITDSHPEIYESLNLRAKLGPEDKDDRKGANIYVHVRRGDVQLDGQNSFRFTSDAIVRRHIDSVRDLAGEGSRVHIVTENPGSEFRRKFKDCEILDEDNPIRALLLLAKADYLIMAKSQFSYVAALASQGKVFYEPYWQGPMPSWTILPFESGTKTQKKRTWAFL
jgi:hypothetical protein